MVCREMKGVSVFWAEKCGKKAAQRISRILVVSVQLLLLQLCKTFSPCFAAPTSNIAQFFLERFLLECFPTSDIR